MSSFRNDHTSEIKGKQKIIERLEKTIKNLNTELDKEKCKNENLQKELNAKSALTEITPNKGDVS